MFAKAERLSRAEFTHTYKYGRKVHMPGFLLVALSAPTRKVRKRGTLSQEVVGSFDRRKKLPYNLNSTCKVAAVVGKKVAKSAVARNLIRRRLYAALFESKVRRGHIVLIAKPAASAYSYSHLETEVASALDRVERVDV